MKSSFRAKSVYVLPLGMLTVFAALTGACGKTTPAAAITSEIDGTWKGECKVGSPLGNGNGASTNMVFVASNGTFTFTQTVYVDAACTTNYVKIAATGAFTIGAATTTPADSKQFDMVHATFTATPIATGSGAVLTSGFGCTGVTFTDGTTTDINGKTCGGSNTANPVAGAKLLGVYKLTTTATPNTLNFGQEGDGGTTIGAPVRPTVLATGTESVLVKQ